MNDAVGAPQEADTVRALSPRGRPLGMQEVEVSREVDAPRDAVLEALSPRAIVEWAGTYDVWHVEETDDGSAVTCGTSELHVVLDFSAADGGYVYRQRGENGPFGEMYASVSAAEGDPTVVTARSCFTFDTPLARVIDWLAARERRMELRRLLDGLGAAVGDPHGEFV